MIIKEISIKEIKSLENIRQIRHDNEIQNLMHSIKDNGLLQPIGVKEEKGFYRLLWGHRRFDACAKLGWKTIPAVIFMSKDDVLTEQEFFVINAVENLQKKANSLFELGRVCTILKKTMSNGEIATRLSIPKSRVENALLEIRRIPVKWQKRIRLLNDGSERRGDIPMKAASVVASLRISAALKNQLLQYISSHDCNVGTISVIGSLLATGKSLKEAINIASRYKHISIKVYLDKDKYSQVLEKHKGSAVDVSVAAYNSLMPGLAVKNVNHN